MSRKYFFIHCGSVRFSGRRYGEQIIVDNGRWQHIKVYNQDDDKGEEGALRDTEIKLCDIAKVCYCT